VRVCHLTRVEGKDGVMRVADGQFRSVWTFAGSHKITGDDDDKDQNHLLKFVLTRMSVAACLVCP
jgi:hypothetical protein